MAAKEVIDVVKKMNISNRLPENPVLIDVGDQTFSLSPGATYVTLGPSLPGSDITRVMFDSTDLTVSVDALDTWEYWNPLAEKLGPRLAAAVQEAERNVFKKGDITLLYQTILDCPKPWTQDTDPEPIVLVDNAGRLCNDMTKSCEPALACLIADGRHQEARELREMMEHEAIPVSGTINKLMTLCRPLLTKAAGRGRSTPAE